MLLATPARMAPALRGAPHGRVAIVGGGIIGLATAYQLLRTRPGTNVTVVEKELTVGQHQTSHNSGVLHAGLYYRPGSLKARLATSGIRQMKAFCRENAIPHETCGKLVVATGPQELSALRTLLERGRQNGLAGLEWLDGEQIAEIEPHAVGVAAVRVPEEGIVDFGAVAVALARHVEKLGGRIATGSEVTALRPESGGGWLVETSGGELEGDLLVNCAGLYADRVARLAGERPEVQILPFRGEYYRLRPDRENLVRHLIYPVPDAVFPFLGVHLTRMIGGGVEAGPNAVLAFSREGYRKRDVRVRELAEALSYPGLWRFLARYPGMSFSELRRSFSRELFAVAIRRLVPAITADDLLPGGAGVRAQAMLPSGELVQDFSFLSRPTALHVLNAPSPGATAALAIGAEIVRVLEDRLD